MIAFGASKLILIDFPAACKGQSMSRRLWSFFALTLILCLLAACQPASPTANVRKLVYGLTLSVSGIDPHINSNSELGIVLRQVYDTLVYRDPNTKEIVPGLAKDWTISPDGLTYTFNLREGVMFHDGTLLTAEAVAANFQRMTNPENASQKARFLLGPIASYQIVDNDTINLILSEPYTPLLDGLSQVYTAIGSPKAFEEHGLLRYQFHQVGTGPFIFTEYVPEQKIILKRNPAYTWGPAFYGELPENAVDEIEFRFFLDAATRAAALRNGEVQIMGEILPTDARTLANDPAFKVVPVPIPGQPLQFYMNLKKAPTDNLAVRQALLYGSNRGGIGDVVYQGFSPVAWGPLSAVTPFYNPNVNNLYAYNEEQARSVLALGGYTDSDNDGYVDQGGKPLEIILIQPPWGLVPQVAQLLQDQWRSIGIRVVIEPVPNFPTLREKVTSGEYNLVAFDTSGLDASILNTRYLGASTDNWTGYSNGELDRMLVEATHTQDEAARREYYFQIQAIIMQEALILPIRDYVNLNAHSVRVTGLQFDPYGWFPLLYNVAIAPAEQ